MSGEATPRAIAPAFVIAIVLAGLIATYALLVSTPRDATGALTAGRDFRSAPRKPGSRFV